MPEKIVPFHAVTSSSWFSVPLFNRRRLHFHYITVAGRHSCHFAMLILFAHCANDANCTWRFVINLDFCPFNSAQSRLPLLTSRIKSSPVQLHRYYCAVVVHLIGPICAFTYSPSVACAVQPPTPPRYIVPSLLSAFSNAFWLQDFLYEFPL